MRCTRNPLAPADDAMAAFGETQSGARRVDRDHAACCGSPRWEVELCGAGATRPNLAFSYSRIKNVPLLRLCFPDPGRGAHNRRAGTFQTVSTIDAKTIAGRPVALDAHRKLLPWPMPEETGYSYNSHLMTQWSILWDQYNRQRYYYFHCCFDFDRSPRSRCSPIFIGRTRPRTFAP